MILFLQRVRGGLDAHGDPYGHLAVGVGDPRADGPVRPGEVPGRDRGGDDGGGGGERSRVQGPPHAGLGRRPRVQQESRDRRGGEQDGAERGGQQQGLGQRAPDHQRQPSAHHPGLTAYIPASWQA
ncbi:hypothetical protein GCM10027612_50920 [Microbispora bryophytorum subsp. camponoti]